MGLGDHLRRWQAKLAGDDQKAREAQRRILIGRAEGLDRDGRAEEAVEVYVEAGETARAVVVAQRARLFARAAEILESAGRVAEAARAREQAGDWGGAGRLHEKAGDLKGAEACFAKSGALRGFLERHGQVARAAQLGEEEGDFEGAAAAFERAKDLASAERCLRKLGRVLAVAEMYARNGDPARAAPAFEEAAILSKAAEAYSAAGLHRDALRLMGPMARVAMAAGKGVGGKSLEEGRALARRAADHAVAAGEPLQAAELLERAGDLARAAECYLESKPAKAAELFRKLGDRARAAAALEKSGDARGAELLRAEPGRAVELLQEDGRHLEAAEILAREGRTLEAAAALASGGRYPAAAQLLMASGDLVGAAEAYEAGGMLGEAEKLYRHAGHDEGLLRVYSRRGDRRELAKIYVRRGDHEAAVRALQALEQDAETAGLLAHCFREMGMTAQALLKIEEVARREPVGPESLDLHYEYARLLEGEGRKAEAIAVYDSILAVRLDYGDVLQRLQKLRAPQPPPPPPVASVPPDRFEVLREIDRGGQGIICRARDRLLGRTVALKSLRPDGPTKELLSEAKSIAALQHPNIVTLYEVFEQAGTIHLVLEFLEGETLLQRIGREGALPTPEVARIGKAICSALEFAHGRGIVHRDIKPSNVMLLPEGGVKVLDFGLARSFEGQEITSTQCGTPFYMAPEQILCRRPDARTDLYALGATLYQALTGQPPFSGQDVFYQHLNCFPAPARSRVASIPMKMDFLVLRCLEKKSEDRPASAAEVADLLDRL